MMTMAQEKAYQHYPLLRNLHYSPLKHGDDQYVVLWDPTGLSPDKLIVPLNLFYLFQYFDGKHSLEQLGAEYLKKYGEFLMPDRLVKLVAELDEKLFLEGERYEKAKQQAVADYRAMSVRPAAFAGRSYESTPERLCDQLEGFFASQEGPGLEPSARRGQSIRGIVAPNYELKEAGPIYAWAYKELKEAQAPEVFVILGTCQTSLDRGIALTDKDFETPLGRVPICKPVIDYMRLHGGERFFEEDIRHRSDYSIEFQLPMLQHVVGTQKPFTIVPILCSFPPAMLVDIEYRPLFDHIDQFLALFKRAIRETNQNMCVIASANLAHIGIRYGDRTPPTDFSFHRCMQTDLEMLKKVEELDAEGFAEFLVHEGDKRHVTGFPAIFLLLKLIQAQKGEVLRYDRQIVDQFNSTITYASMVFY